MPGQKGEPERAMNLKFLSCDHSGDGQPGAPCKLVLKRNLKECVLYAHSKADQKRWVSALIPLTVQSDFHNRFIPVKTIGKGSFAKVFPFYFSSFLHRFIWSKTKSQG